MKPVTGKMGCMSAADIHEERLETLRKEEENPGILS